MSVEDLDWLSELRDTADHLLALAESGPEDGSGREWAEWVDEVMREADGLVMEGKPPGAILDWVRGVLSTRRGLAHSDALPQLFAVG